MRNLLSLSYTAKPAFALLSIAGASASSEHAIKFVAQSAGSVLFSHCTEFPARLHLS